MNFQVLARKWRPRNFTEVVGQEHVVKSLTNALLHQRLHHAYLFTGTRGVGKTTLARILAKAINCEQTDDFNPCGECSVCLDIDAGHFIDLIEVDAASRTKVEDTRDLLDNVQYAPGRGRYKIYLIDEVHMLSGHSFNALLKTLEEPPPHVKFLLATTDPQKIPVTVLSRCLQFNLKRLYPDQIRPQLESLLKHENTEYQLPALQLLAKAADGSMRDALSLLDQAIVYGNGRVHTDMVRTMMGTVAIEPVEALLQALARQDAEAMLEQIGELAELSPDFLDVSEQLLQMLHRIALTQVLPAAAEMEEHAQTIKALADTLSKEDVQLYYQIALVGRRDLELAPDLRSGFEMLMLRMLAFKPVDASVVSEAATKSATKPISKPAGATAVQEVAPKSHESTEQTDWAAMIRAMKIGGMTRELANNCIIESIDDQVCTLLLDPGHKQLRGDTTEQKLLKAIRDYFGRPLKLVIEVREINQNTPAVQINRERLQKQEEAEQVIEADENIKALKEKFDARVIPGTIEPL